MGFLSNLGWPEGLRRQMVENWEQFPYRFMILDDSGSMSMRDGTMLMKQGKFQKPVGCSRWKEMSSSVEFHAELADVSKAPTEFCFLNNGAPIVVGEEEDDGENMGKVKKILDGSPSGGTPLVRVLNEVHAKIKRMEPTLRQRNQKVSLTIFTDGVASDGNLEAVLRKFHHLPVWVVIRLCTSEDSIVDYYGEIDNNIETEMDVLDDQKGEAAEVYKVNNFIAYGQPLHLMRESGCRVKVFDHLDERRLHPAEQLDAVITVLGGKKEDYVHPDLDLQAFKDSVATALNRADQVWNPHLKKMTPWVDVNKLGNGGGCCTIA